MRIAFLADPLDRQYGGIHVYTREILNALTTIDKSNEYIIIRRDPKKEFPNAEEVVVPYSTYPGYRLWRLFYQIPKLLVKRKVDIVVEPAHFGPFNLPDKIKRITVIHDMTVFLYPEYHTFLSQWLQRKLFPRIIQNAHHIITNSHHTTTDVLHFFPNADDKISSVLLGKNNTYQPTENEAVIQRYNLRTPYILYVGTLEPRKNIIKLIESFNRFKQDTGLPHQLVLVGKKGWKSKPMFKSIKNSPYTSDIIWLGYLDKNDLPSLYTMAEVFVYPSIYEGFGLPILEAMACGTPVITTHSSSLPEVGGQAVVYSDVESVQKLSQHITTLCTNPSEREKYRSLGLAQAQKFNWTKTAERYLNIFDSVAKT